MKDNLIDYVFARSNLSFLSDMKFCKDKRVYDIVEQIPPEDFSTEAWNNLYLYLFNEKITSDSPTEAKSFVIHALQ